MGRAIKIFMGKEEEEWLEDDENLSKWENNELTASDRRIFIGHSATLRVGMVIFVYTQHANNIPTGAPLSMGITMVPLGCTGHAANWSYIHLQYTIFFHVFFTISFIVTSLWVPL